jgi:S1-C subfamily serine protease
LLSAFTCALALTVLTGAATAAHKNRAVATVLGVVDVNTNLGYQGSAAAGTGIVLTASGEILTNNHVIRGATRIHVTDTDNGRTYAATVVGYNLAADIAVLQLTNASGLQTAPIGNSASARLGDSVTAVGNAGGVGGTPSAVTGAITHLNQSITVSDERGGSERLSGLIQTSAPIQPGDSGGPLVGNAGQVIGMNTAGSPSSAFEPRANQAFAIPINRASSIARQIEAKVPSTTVHIGPTPFLGVDVRPSNSFSDRQPGAGLSIVAVLPASPVQKAGLTAGDVLNTLNGHKITTSASLTSLLIAKKPGTTVQIGWVDQSGTAHNSSVRLATGPPQ